MKCRTCLSVSKANPIFLESRIFEGKYWIIEHAYPIKLRGWFVIVLKNHKEALHELSKVEFTEFRLIQENLIKALHKVLKTQKEYSCCFAEGKGFKHIHFHIIAIPNNLSDELRGKNIFSLIKVAPNESLPRSQILSICEPIKHELCVLLRKHTVMGP